MAVILSWALKRAAISRMSNLASGNLSPWYGTELFATGHPEFTAPVQVAYFLPGEPDRLCVYGTSVRASRRQATAEGSGVYPTGQVNGLYVETSTLELRVRCSSPGEDVEAVDLITSQLCQAVASAMMDGPALFQSGTINLTAINQDPTTIAPLPEPNVITNVSLVFTVEAITS
jgi:hypothetical protein